MLVALEDGRHRARDVAKRLQEGVKRGQVSQRRHMRGELATVTSPEGFEKQRAWQEVRGRRPPGALVDAQVEQVLFAGISIPGAAALALSRRRALHCVLFELKGRAQQGVRRRIQQRTGVCVGWVRMEPAAHQVPRLAAAAERLCGRIVVEIILHQRRSRGARGWCSRRAVSSSTCRAERGRSRGVRE